MSAKPTTRIAIITGAAQGMGEAIALRLADDGLDVVLNDIPSKADLLAAVVKQVEAKGRRALAVPGMPPRRVCQSLVDTAVAKFGGLDVVLRVLYRGTSTGIFTFVALATMEDVDRVMDINLRGVMLAYKYAAIQMIKQGRGGRIIGGLCDRSHISVLRLNMAAYSASKFAVRGYTQACGVFPAEHTRMGKHKITSASVMHPDDEKNGGPASTAKLVSRRHASRHPFADPSVIADLVSYLASPATYFVTGQSINVDGGLYMD
ncbi:hypothetical protein B0H21DRAFT_762584 [Amylocystis lapponica]|nr:hypothetical protein B0H21DRAFT_762584 [Amylocystis lapponica]